mmetsp:Transcript_4773/g.17146  ORF Transcript_4773/g.17146 Transcript_4773/m.17146 type:complete len:203 (-) Transcript_4773:1632-2240(-)
MGLVERLRFLCSSSLLELSSRVTCRPRPRHSGESIRSCLYNDFPAVARSSAESVYSATVIDLLWLSHGPWPRTFHGSPAPGLRTLIFKVMVRPFTLASFILLLTSTATSSMNFKASLSSLKRTPQLTSAPTLFLFAFGSIGRLSTPRAYCMSIEQVFTPTSCSSFFTSNAKSWEHVLISSPSRMRPILYPTPGNSPTGRSDM